MMKYVQSVALFLLMMVMMMTMMASVSAGPLRPSLNHSRHDDEETVSLENKEENSNRFESRQDVNNTLDNITGNVTSNSSMSDTPSVFTLPLDTQESSQVVHRIALYGCFLPTCLTVNLGSSLQVGEETAGGATTDPFGIGKK